MEGFTGLLIRDQDGKGYTAIVVEFPGIIAEGETKEDAKRNLADNLKLVLEHKRKEIMQSYTKETTESFAVTA